MAPAKPKGWEDEEESTPPSSPPVIPVRKSKYGDEEEEDSDVLESWSAAEDSEDEREKAKAEAARKAKAETEAAANKKTKAQRIAENQAQHRAKAAQAAAESSEEEEDEVTRRRRLQKTEQEADLKHAEDLFGNIGISSKRTATKAVVTADPNDPTATIDLGALALFNPDNKASFTKLRETLVPILAASSKKAHYAIFLQDFTRDLTKDLPSGDIKVIASKLTTLSNEKMKEEKAADRGAKKSKAAKTKTSLVASRDESFRADTTSYDNEFDE
ncbi:hypothetical protein GP486_005521 [Trichoglossum hirsutum]|uniref:Eukaryotic translation initiation factor 3 subunit J n=1 Tax=Trichoglossum hirsutum TaxID=265104 RepID=A0A9P8L9A3_9PEZI|nr:hypothetical protein GP486_005521 [Trichoglossum hirsutum]